MSALVSIYLPTHDRVSLLRRAVESVIGQSYPHWELIVVNDGSSDRTRGYLDEQARAEPRLRAIHQASPLGAHRARNAAIQAARGEFITGLDDDDYFHPRRIECFVDHWHSLERAGERFSCLFSQDFWVCGGQTRVTEKPQHVLLEDLFYHNTIGNQVFTRRERFVATGLFDERMPAWQDLEAFIRLLARFGPARLLDEPLYYLNLEPRRDRISVGSKQRILEAYRLLCSKHEHMPPVMKQALFLQAFSGGYGFPAAFEDVREFLRYGVHVRTLKSVAGICARRLGLLPDPTAQLVGHPGSHRA